MDSYDDADRLRARRNAAEAEASRTLPVSGPGTISFLARVEATEFGEGVFSPKFYNMAALRLMGEPTEGAAGEPTDLGWTFVAAYVGPDSSSPTTGDLYICTHVRDRWAFGS